MTTLARLLLSLGTRLDGVDKRGRTALHRAAGKNKHSAVAALLTMGSQALNKPDRDGQVPETLFPAPLLFPPSSFFFSLSVSFQL